MKLVINEQVQFNPIDHIYTIGDKKLVGVTAILKSMLFADKYKNIPKYILENAANRGNTIHSQIEMYVNEGLVSNSIEFQNYLKLMSEYGLNPTVSEYLVSDNQNFASFIDLVDEWGNLYDIKTTYSLDRDYLMWQLNIYAYLFEIQNGQPANKLFGIWLNKDKAELIELPRIDASKIEDLLTCYLDDKQFNSYLEVVDKDRILAIEQIERSIIALKENLAALESKQKALHSGLLELMRENGITTFETDNLRITVKDSYTRNSVDSSKLKDKYPEIYAECLKTSNVKESLLVKIKEQTIN